MFEEVGPWGVVFVRVDSDGSGRGDRVDLVGAVTLGLLLGVEVDESSPVGVAL